MRIIKAYIYPASITFVLGALVFVYQNCGQGSSVLSKKTSASQVATPLTLKASSTTASYGANVQLYASGGVPPYTYFNTSTAAADGYVNSTTGMFIAPQKTFTASLYAVDATAAIATTQINVSQTAGSTLNVVATETSVIPGNSILFVATGGSGYFQYTLTQSPPGGTLSPYGIYLAPTTGFLGAVKVTVYDTQTGARATASATVATATTYYQGQTSTGGERFAFVNPVAFGGTAGNSWTANHLTDGTINTCYSSTKQNSATPTNPPYVGLYLGDQASKTTGKTYGISHLTLGARDTNSGVLGFPKSYTIKVLDNRSSQYITVGTYTAQPDNYGQVRIYFPYIYATALVLIVPTKLTTDNSSSSAFYFQLCEVSP